MGKDGKGGGKGRSNPRRFEAFALNTAGQTKLFLDDGAMVQKVQEPK